MRWCVGSAKQESLLVCVDGVAQACRDLGCPALSHMCNTCCFWWPLHAGRLWGGHHLSLWAIGRLTRGPHCPDQVRSLRLSQLEPETASEMPFRNGNSPGAGRQLPHECGALSYRAAPRPGRAVRHFGDSQKASGTQGLCKQSQTLPETTCELHLSWRAASRGLRSVTPIPPAALVEQLFLKATTLLIPVASAKVYIQIAYFISTYTSSPLLTSWHAIASTSRSCLFGGDVPFASGTVPLAVLYQGSAHQHPLYPVSKQLSAKLSLEALLSFHAPVIL